MSRPHIILLGDRTKAARWVGYAEGQFELQVEKYGPNFQTAIQPRMDISIEMRMFGGVRKIIINARFPMGATFAGVSYDHARYGGWGAPYLSEDEFGNPQPVTTREIPYGTEFSTDHPEVLLASRRKLPWRPMRFPQYEETYPDLEYGTINWLSENRRTNISWDGTNSRHRYVVPNEDDVFHGYAEGNCSTGLNEGLMFTGQVFTRGELCESAVYYQQGVYRITGTHEGAAQTLSGYDYENALSSNVYKDGEVLWSDSTGKVVTAACLVSRLDGDGVRYRELRVVLGEYDSYRGIHKEHLRRINLSNENEVLSDEELDDYELQIVPIATANVKYLLPYENVNNGAFSTSGRKLVLLRNFISIEDSTFVRTTRVVEYTVEEEPEDSTHEGALSGISLTPEEGVTSTRTVLWDNRKSSGAAKITRIDDEKNADLTHYVAYGEGDFVIAADYVAEEVVYAYVHTDQTETTDQTLSTPDTCDLYTSTQLIENKEYLYFSNDPQSHIDLLDTSLLRETTINVDHDPDMHYRKTYFRWTLPTIFSIDARYSAAVIMMSVSNSWWQVRAADDGQAEYLVKYEPEDEITQDFSVAVYLTGQKIYETAPERTFISFEYSSLIPKVIPCQQGIIDFDPYDVNDPLTPTSQNEGVSFGHWQLVAQRIEDGYVDMVVSGTWKAYNYDPVTYVFRYDPINDTILRDEPLAEWLEIAEFFNTDDEEALSTHGCYSNVGLI